MSGTVEASFASGFSMESNGAKSVAAWTSVAPAARSIDSVDLMANFTIDSVYRAKGARRTEGQYAILQCSALRSRRGAPTVANFGRWSRSEYGQPPTARAQRQVPVSSLRQPPGGSDPAIHPVTAGLG